MNDHPIKALGDYLRKVPLKPLSRAEVARLKEAGRRAFIGEPVFEINSLDAADQHAERSPFDEDKIEAMENDEVIETNNSR